MKCSFKSANQYTEVEITEGNWWRISDEEKNPKLIIPQYYQIKLDVYLKDLKFCFPTNSLISVSDATALNVEFNLISHNVIRA